MSVLDDLKMIHQRDAQDALGVAGKQPDQLLYDFGAVNVDAIDFTKVENIVVGSMGGSALAATLFSSWPEAIKPMEVWRNYDLPKYASVATLFIASSYSGNTEETLSALAAAEQRGCQIVVVTAGGALLERATEKGYPCYVLPTGYQPRMAVLYNFAALIQLLEAGKLIEAGSYDELKAAAPWLQEQAAAYAPDVPTDNNYAKQLALDLIGSSIVVYAGPKLYPAAYKWKISFNENAKTVAWCNEVPEFSHNEFLGWTSHPLEKPYKVINLIGSIEHDRVQKRFDITEKLLSGKKPAGDEVRAAGETHLQQLLFAVMLGDFVSLYVALLNGLDPTPVDIIENLKEELKKA